MLTVDEAIDMAKKNMERGLEDVSDWAEMLELPSSLKTVGKLTVPLGVGDGSTGLPLSPYGGLEVTSSGGSRND